MTRVLQTMAGAVHGGAEGFFVRMVKSLHEAGLDQKVVMRPGGGREADLAQAGLDVAPAPFRTLFDLTTSRVLARAIREFQPDIALAWMSRAAAMTPHPGPGKVLAARLGGFYHLKYFTRCDHLIGNTRYLVQWLESQGWPPDRVHYLPNFTDARPGTPVARSALDTPAEAKVILSLGRFHSDKAFDVLLAALDRLPGAILWLGGDGPDGAELKKRARNLGVFNRVRWLGWRADTAALAAAADVLCCPSRVEPLGNVILEAWAYGLPVVAAASSGPAELIADGETGLLAPVEDAGALAAALSRVLADRSLGEDLSRRAKAELDARFSRAAVTARYLDFFEQVTG